MPDFKLVDVEGLREELLDYPFPPSDIDRIIGAYTVKPEWKRLDEVEDWPDYRRVWCTDDMGQVHPLILDLGFLRTCVSKTPEYEPLVYLVTAPPLPDSPGQEDS